MNKVTKLIFGGLFGASAFMSIGVSIGATISRRIHERRTLYCGSLRIDRSESDEPPRLFLELEVPLEYLKDVETASFKVIDKSYIYANKTRPIVEKSKLKEDRNENRN